MNKQGKFDSLIETKNKLATFGERFRKDMVLLMTLDNLSRIALLNSEVSIFLEEVMKVDEDDTDENILVCIIPIIKQLQRLINTLNLDMYYSKDIQSEVTLNIATTSNMVNMCLDDTINKECKDLLKYINDNVNLLLEKAEYKL